MLAKKILFGLLILTLTLGFSPVLAQSDNGANATPDLVEQLLSQTQQVDELVQVTEQDFGNIKTGWFNNLWRDIRIIFTFDPVKKADLELEKASAVLLKVRQELTEKAVDPEKIKEKIEKANQRYEKAMARVKARLEKYKQEHPDDQRLEKFLDKFSDFSFKHQMVFKALEDKTPEQVRKLIEQRRQEHLKRFMQTMEKVEDKTKLKFRLKKMLVDDQAKFEHRVMRARLLEEIEKLDLDEQTKEKIEELKNEIKPLWEDLHETYQQAIERRQTTIESLKQEAEENKDKLLSEPEARQEFIQKVNQEMTSLREENKKIYQEKKQEIEQFIKEHKDELLEIKNEIKPLQMRTQIKNQNKTQRPRRINNSNE